MLRVVDDTHFDLETEFFFVFPDYAEADFDSTADPATHSGPGVNPPYIRVIPRTTDLASVPKPLWGLIASYGRQTMPALLHDQLCDQANAKRTQALSPGGSPSIADQAYPDRTHADNIFRHALRSVGVEWMRRWTFWAGVTFGRYWIFRKKTAFALGIVGALLSAVFYGGLGWLVTSAAESAWHWPPRLPGEAAWHSIGLAFALCVAPFLLAFVAYRHRAWALLQVVAYVGLPVAMLLALGYVVLFWTRVVPWAALWLLSRIPAVHVDPGPAPPLTPTGLRPF